MTLPFGTRVSLNTDPTVIGVVVGVSSSTREGYAVAWPNGTRETRWREELTVVPPVAWPLWAVRGDCELEYIHAPTAEHARSWYAAENGVVGEELKVHPAKTAEEHLALTMSAYEAATARAAELSRALHEIAVMLGLPPDAEPKTVVDALRMGIADPFKLVAPSFAGLFGMRGAK